MVHSGISRRDLLLGVGAASFLPLFPGAGFANVPVNEPLHGLSAFGDLKYPADFTHFDYASLDAPKGGTFNFQPGYWYFNQNTLTFNTLNSFVLTGDAPPRMEMCFDSLMTRAIDEPDAAYGLLAESVTLSEDRNTFTFKLRPEARFHDGSPLSADDVAFTYDLLKEKGHPQLLLPLTEMEEASAISPYEVRLTFSGKQTDSTILNIVGYPIFSRASIEENGFDSGSLTPLLGSGAYKVGRISAGQYIEYERVADYWARDLPVARGFNHFDRIRVDFYRDRTAGFEAFKKGDTTWREEFTSRSWATAYDFPAAQDGRVIKREFPGELVPIMQAWALNQRRERFQDIRIREAIGLCFDFEWTNRNLFYDAYERSDSLFERSPYKADGEASGKELALLNRLRDQIPEAALAEPVKQPVSNGSGRDRNLLRQARALLTEAGWSPRNGMAVNGKGKRLTLEILQPNQSGLHYLSPFVENLRAIGIDAAIRVVDAAQYQVRMTSFDFDMIGMAMRFGATPTTDGLEQSFHSRAANLEGSRNYPGTADPAIDMLIEEAGKAQTREDLTIALRVLDRVLRARRDWIPNWHSANHRVAYWDMFGFKEPKPDYFFPVEALWWYDAEKAKVIGKA